MKNYIVKVEGRVQGVWFRKFAQNRAMELELGGYAKNLEDGSVEIGISGKEESVKKFLEAIKKGPPLARVDRVTILETEEGFGNSFEILR